MYNPDRKSSPPPLFRSMLFSNNQVQRIFSFVVSTYVCGVHADCVYSYTAIDHPIYTIQYREVKVPTVWDMLCREKTDPVALVATWGGNGQPRLYRARAFPSWSLPLQNRFPRNQISLGTLYSPLDPSLCQNKSSGLRPLPLRILPPVFVGKDRRRPFNLSGFFLLSTHFLKW